MRALNKTLLLVAAAAFLAACADPTGGGGGSGGGSGGSGSGGSASASRSNARAMAVSNTGMAVVAQSYPGVDSGSFYNFTGDLQVSSDSGATWTSTGTTAYWTKVHASNDGTKLVALASSAGGSYSMSTGPTGTAQPIYYSTDSGATWQWATGLPVKYWSNMAVSPDGTKIFVQGSNTSGPVLYSSTDGGVTFTLASLPSTSPITGQTVTYVNLLGASNTHVYLNASYSTTVSGTTVTRSGAFAVPMGSFSTGSTWIAVDPSSTGTPPNASVRTISPADDGNTILIFDAPSGTPKLHLATLSGGAFSYTHLTSLDGTAQAYHTVTLSSDGTQIFLAARGAPSGSNYPTTYGSGSLKKAAVTDTSWTTLSTFGSQAWALMAISPNGNRILASDGSPSLQHSTDGGTTVASHTFNNHPSGTPGPMPTMPAPGGGGSGGAPSGGSGGGSGSSVTLTGTGLASGFGTSGIVNLSSSNYSGGELVAGTGVLYGMVSTSGSFSSPTTVAKFATNGSFDTTFGTAGMFTFTPGAVAAALGINATITNLNVGSPTLDASNGLYLSGQATYQSSGSYVYKYFVTKLTSGGAVDTSFGTNGYVDLTSYFTTSGGMRIAKQSSGVVAVLAGYANETCFKAIKISSTGSIVGSPLDIYSAFHTAEPNAGWIGVYDLTTGSDDSVYVLSHGTPAFFYSGSSSISSETAVVGKLTTSSSGVALDTSWGTSGLITVDLQAAQPATYHREFGLAVDSSNRLLLGYVGYSSGNSWQTWSAFEAKRYSSTGVVDGSFSLTPPSGVQVVNPKFVIAGSSLYVASGTHGNVPDTGYILKFNASTGAVDTSFGTAGKLVPVASVLPVYTLVTDGTNLFASVSVYRPSAQSVSAMIKITP